MPRILHKKPTAPSRTESQFAPGNFGQALSTSALEKDRELRYQNAADIRIDLKRLKRDRIPAIRVR